MSPLIFCANAGRFTSTKHQKHNANPVDRPRRMSFPLSKCMRRLSRGGVISAQVCVEAYREVKTNVCIISSNFSDLRSGGADTTSCESITNVVESGLRFPQSVHSFTSTVSPSCPPDSNAADVEEKGAFVPIPCTNLCTNVSVKSFK